MTMDFHWFEEKLQGSQLISLQPNPWYYDYHGRILFIESSREASHILHVTLTHRWRKLGDSEDCLTWSVSLTVDLIDTLFELLDSEVPNGKRLVLSITQYEVWPPLPHVCHTVADELRTHPSLCGHFHSDQNRLLVYQLIDHLHKIQHVVERFDGPCFHECDTLIQVSDGFKEGVTERRRVQFFCDDLNWYILFVSDPITFANIYNDTYVRFPELEKAIPALKRASRLTRCEYAVHPRLNKLHWYIDNWKPQLERKPQLEPISVMDVGNDIPTTHFLHWLAVRRKPTGNQYDNEQEYLRAICSSVHAACCIQKEFRKAIVDPGFPLCRSRLKHEFEDLSETVTG